jgi:hypothetical protein
MTYHEMSRNNEFRAITREGVQILAVILPRGSKREKGMGKADCWRCQTLAATPAEPGDILTEFDSRILIAAPVGP